MKIIFKNYCKNYCCRYITDPKKFQYKQNLWYPYSLWNIFKTESWRGNFTTENRKNVCGDINVKTQRYCWKLADKEKLVPWKFPWNRNLSLVQKSQHIINHNLEVTKVTDSSLQSTARKSALNICLEIYTNYSYWSKNVAHILEKFWSLTWKICHGNKTSLCIFGWRNESRHKTKICKNLYGGAL